MASVSLRRYHQSQIVPSYAPRRACPHTVPTHADHLYSPPYLPHHHLRQQGCHLPDLSVTVENSIALTYRRHICMSSHWLYLSWTGVFLCCRKCLCISSAFRRIGSSIFQKRAAIPSRYER